MLMTDPDRLADDDLIAAIASLAGAERSAAAALIAHLAELEARNLHLAQGFRSLFGYCRRVLHCSEHESYNRMEAVHAARRFPVILALLAEGRLHLTAVRLLAPHLKGEDHLALLGGAIHKSKREVVALLARWFPSPDVPPSIRRLPAQVAKTAGLPVGDGHGVTVSTTRPAAGGTSSPVSTPAPASGLQVDRGVAPLSARRYKLQITMDEEAHADLSCLQELLCRAIPGGDPAAIVARALKLLRQKTEREVFSATSRPQPIRPSTPGSRPIPAHVERAVWQRDQGQCAFGGTHARCEERSFLEFHHLTPWVVGGAASVENIALRCRSHNRYEASVYFAPIRAAMDERMNSFRNESR